jgi:hypothetical protein
VADLAGRGLFAAPGRRVFARARQATSLMLIWPA